MQDFTKDELWIIEEELNYAIYTMAKWVEPNGIEDHRLQETKKLHEKVWRYINEINRTNIG